MGQSIWIILKHRPHLSKLRQILKTSHRVVVLCLSPLRIRRDASKEILNSSVRMSISCSECCDTLLPRESHGYQVVDLGLWTLWGWLKTIFLLFCGFVGRFLLRLRFRGLFLFFNFGLGRWFLRRSWLTKTWLMTTKKSVSLSPNFSSDSSSLVVLPLKMIFMDSAVMPLSAYILCFRLPIWLVLIVRWRLVQFRPRRPHPLGSLDWFSCEHLLISFRLLYYLYHLLIRIQKAPSPISPLSTHLLLIYQFWHY